MATKGNTFPTLKDYYSQLEGGEITSTINVLNLRITSYVFK